MQDEVPNGDQRPDVATCDRCGARLIAPSSMHAERSCQTCGKTVYHTDPGVHGQGIQIQTGDRFVIPAGAISLSLDRNASSGQFTRAGIAWFASMRLLAGAPETPDNIDEMFTSYLDECLSVLRRSEALKDLDLDSEVGMRAASERINTTDQLRGSREYWALALGAALAETVTALNDNDAPRVAWAMNRLTNAHAMLVFKLDLEDMIWRGYLTESLRSILQVWQVNRQNADEEFWQRTLAGNPLVVSQAFATPIVILKGKAYVGGKGIENSQGKVTDFLVANHLSENVALIEIKTPKTRLLGSTYRAGVYAMSPDVLSPVSSVNWGAAAR